MRLLLFALALVAALLAAVHLVRARSRPDDGAASSPIPRTGRPFGFRVEARLEEVSERNPDYESSRFTVVLRDAKGREVETPEIRLELGGVPLDYRVAGGNYYDRHPSYRLRDDSGFRFEPDTAWELVARRGEEAPLPVARIRSPKPMGLESLRVPTTHPRGEDLAVAWSGLAQPVDLLVTRTLAFTDEHGNRGFIEGGPNGDDALRRRIGSRGLALPDGRMTIPASYFADVGEKPVASIRLELTARGEGGFLCPVLEPSTVAAERRIALPVEVVDARAR